MKIFFIHIRNPFKKSGTKLTAQQDASLQVSRRVLKDAIENGRGHYPSTVKLAVKIAKVDDEGKVKPG